VESVFVAEWVLAEDVVENLPNPVVIHSLAGAPVRGQVASPTWTVVSPARAGATADFDHVLKSAVLGRRPALPIIRPTTSFDSRVVPFSTYSTIRQQVSNKSLLSTPSRPTQR
jgi:hypothetical protein